MSKLNGNLSYKDWCILKHGLETRIESKNELIKFIDGIRKESGMLADEIPYNRIVNDDAKFLKELEEEKKTLERVTILVDGYKRYISGQEKDYERSSNL